MEAEGVMGGTGKRTKYEESASGAEANGNVRK